MFMLGPSYTSIVGGGGAGRPRSRLCSQQRDSAEDPQAQDGGWTRTTEKARGIILADLHGNLN